MKLYLVAPRNPESFWTFDRILPELGKGATFPNLALPTLAAMTPPEHEVVLCDETVEPIDFDTDADWVGLTGYIVHRQRMFEILDTFRARGKKLVVGGPFATLCPEQLRERADVVFVGEAEETWSGFLRDAEAGAPRAEYHTEELPSLERTPVPRFDLLKLDRYRSMPIQFARGCPYTCEFCDIIVMYGRRPRAKRTEQVMAELEELARLGVPNVFVVDDNFIGDKKKAKSLLRAIAAWQAERGHPIELMTEASINLAQDAELLSLMRDANFTTLFVGIESPRAASLAETSKHQNLREDIVCSVHRIQAAGIEVMAGMIVGFDHDDPSIFDEQFDFIQDARIPVSMTGLLNALPRTALHERLAAAGRLDQDYTGDQFVFSNVLPAGMTRLELYRGYERLLRRLYDYGNYRARAMAFILGHGEGIRSRIASGPDEVAVLLRTLWSCVLNATPRRAWMTIGMFAETLAKRPSAFRRAVSFALMHKHFHEYGAAVRGELRKLIRELEAAADHAPLTLAPSR